jgi:hypothetical protein
MDEVIQMMKADGRMKWTSEWSFLPKNIRYDNPNINAAPTELYPTY